MNNGSVYKEIIYENIPLLSNFIWVIIQIIPIQNL